MVGFRTILKILKNKIKTICSRVRDYWKSSTKEFKDKLEEDNKFFSKWLPIITVISIFFPLYITLLFYIRDARDKRVNFWSGFLAESCMNLRQAKIFQTGAEGDSFQFNNLFNSNFYRSNWHDSIKELSRKKQDPRLLIAAVNEMESANSILLRKDFFPSMPLKEVSGNIEKKLNEISITSKMCNVITPHFIFEKDIQAEQQEE